MAGNTWPQQLGAESELRAKAGQQKPQETLTVVPETNFFDNLPSPAELDRLDGPVVITKNSAKVQADPHVSQTDLSSGIAVQAGLVIGLLVFTAVLLSNKKRIALGRFLKPVLFIGWFFALLLGGGVLSGIKNSIVASSNDPEVAGWSVGGMYAIFIALMGFLVREIWKIKAPAVTEEQVSVVQPALQSKQDDTIYLAIATELDSGKTDRGLWTRLFAECDGEEAKTRAAYIRARAVQLQRGD